MINLWGRVTSVSYVHIESDNGLCLNGAKPLSKTNVDFICQFDPREKIVKFLSKYITFHWRVYIWNCRLRNVGHIVSGLVSLFGVVTTSSRQWWNLSGSRHGSTIYTSPMVKAWLWNTAQSFNMLIHYDIMTWKRFPHYWPFVGRIHRWPVDSPNKGPVTRFFIVSLFVFRLNKLLYKQPSNWWFETP